MKEIPLYLKTSAEIKRPQDTEYYLFTRNGLFFCRNHSFFQTDVPATRVPRWLSEHEARCELRYPKLPVSALEYIVGFFYRIYQRHASEAIALLLWDRNRQRYRIRIPPQRATVWESNWGRSALDVHYDLPDTLPRGCIIAASIHSHADGDAYSSWTDRDDERYRDGIHVVCGRVDRDPPAFHLEFAVDKHRFPLHFEDFCRGYHARRQLVPRQWLKQVKVTVQRPKTYSTSTYINPSPTYDVSPSKTYKRWR